MSAYDPPLPGDTPPNPGAHAVLELRDLQKAYEHTSA